MYDFGIRNALSGYRVQYRGANTACPGCDRSHWLVGRLVAECAFCGTALGIRSDTAQGAGCVRRAA